MFVLTASGGPCTCGHHTTCSSPPSAPRVPPSPMYTHFTPRTCCVTLGEALPLSGTQFPLLVSLFPRLPQHLEASYVQIAPPWPTVGSVAWPGSTRDADGGFAVTDIDECALPTGGHICSYRCINIPGSFQCSCPSSGYRLAPNGRNCQGEHWGSPGVTQAACGALRCWGAEAGQPPSCGDALPRPRGHTTDGVPLGGGGEASAHTPWSPAPGTAVFRGS